MALYNPENGESDEFFGDDDDDDHIGTAYGALADRDVMARENELKNVGFLESYDEHKETRLQEGFQAGYGDTFDVAFRIGALLGAAAAREETGRKKGKTDGTTAPNNDNAAAKLLRESLIRLEQQSNDTISETKKDLEDLEAEIQGML